MQHLKNSEDDEEHVDLMLKVDMKCRKELAPVEINTSQIS
jgi:hypothetical protein